MAYLDRAEAVLRRVRNLRAPRVVEVGVDEGEMSEALLRGHSGLHLLMVDWWQEIEAGSAYALTGDFADRSWAEWRCAMEQAQGVEARWSGRAKIMEGSSVEIARAVADGSQDLVFIDAAHDYESVRADLAAWRGKVKPGGWLGGHDYLNAPGRPYGVRRAVDGAFPAGVELDAEDTWFVRM